MARTTDLVRVFRVDRAATADPDLPVFLVWATLVAQPTESLQLQTVNAYAASLCLRAKDLDRAIAVTWERTKYGPTLKRASFLKASAA